MRRSKTLSKEAVVALVKDAAKRYAENVELKAKCERYEEALKVTKVWVEGALDNPEPEIVKCAQSDLELIDKALSGEGKKENEPVSFAEWILEYGYEPSFGKRWVDYSINGDNQLTTTQLWEKYQKEDQQ